jgi:hypothetical protein
MGKYVSSGFIAGIGIVVGMILACAGFLYFAIVEEGLNLRTQAVERLVDRLLLAGVATGLALPFVAFLVSLRQRTADGAKKPTLWDFVGPNSLAGDDARTWSEWVRDQLLRKHVIPPIPQSICDMSSGAFLGLSLGVFAWAGLPYFGSEATKVKFYAFTLLGAMFGAWIHRRSIGGLCLWCRGMAVLLGIVGFFGGLIGSVAYYGRSPQVALFAMCVSGPYGAIIGAMLGLVIWAVRCVRA